MKSPRQMVTPPRDGPIQTNLFPTRPLLSFRIFFSIVPGEIIAIESPPEN